MKICFFDYECYSISRIKYGSTLTLEQFGLPMKFRLLSVISLTVFISGINAYKDYQIYFKNIEAI